MNTIELTAVLHARRPVVILGEPFYTPLLRIGQPKLHIPIFKISKLNYNFNHLCA